MISATRAVLGSSSTNSSRMKIKKTSLSPPARAGFTGVSNLMLKKKVPHFRSLEAAPNVTPIIPPQVYIKRKDSKGMNTASFGGGIVA